jgi:hypothetical protein
MDRNADGTYTYAGETLYIRDVLYPDLPPVSEVAAKVTEITENNKKEAAELMAAAARARTDGWTNVAAVYEHMATDHNRGAEMTSNWLVSHGYNPPAAPAATTVADMPVRESIPYWIEHHQHMFEQAREKRQGERSSTVRGLHLMTMATTLNHISLLQSLQRDVALDRKTLSARLEAEMNPTATVMTEERLTRIVEEERAVYGTPTYTAQQLNPPVIVEERVVERTVEVPVERVVERIVEKPVERIVEKPVYIERPAPAARTAGQRQTVRKRRPAK